jgi:hypothetical protein
MQFNLVICGLDSVEARRWINATLVNLVDPENLESLKPLIDGGTEGVVSPDCMVDSTLIRSPSRIQGSGSRNLAYCYLML